MSDRIRCLSFVGQTRAWVTRAQVARDSERGVEKADDYNNEMKVSTQTSSLVTFDEITLLALAGEIYAFAMVEDYEAHLHGRPRLRLHEHLYNFIFFNFGTRYYSELTLQVTLPFLAACGSLGHSRAARILAWSAGSDTVARPCRCQAAARPLVALPIAAGAGSSVPNISSCRVLFHAALECDPVGERKVSIRLAARHVVCHGGLCSCQGDAAAAVAPPNMTAKRLKGADLSILPARVDQVALQAVQRCFVEGKEESQTTLQKRARNAMAEAAFDSDFDLRYRSPAEVASELQVKLFEMASDDRGKCLSMHDVLEVGLSTFLGEEKREQQRLEVMATAPHALCCGCCFAA